MDVQLINFEFFYSELKCRFSEFSQICFKVAIDTGMARNPEKIDHFTFFQLSDDNLLIYLKYKDEQLKNKVKKKQLSMA